MASPYVEPNKYVISLDSLDLGLLPNSYQSRLNNNSTSLWSASNLNGKTDDYFQFEIKPRTHERDTSEIDSSIDGSIEESTCYICDLKVPIAYLTDHENSLKHQAYVKIADVVLDRARQHMLKRDNRRIVHNNDSMYFCGPCVTVVRTTDRGSHEKSKLHKRSLSLDRLLFELVSLYTDDDVTEPKVKHKNKVEEHKLHITDNFIDDNDNDVNSEVDRNLENTVLISDIKATMTAHETEKHKTNSLKVNANDKMKNITPVDNVTIETLDGHEISISDDNFHGFMRIGKHHIQCKVCKVIVKNEQEHKTSKEHVNKILQPFKDKHCIRILNDSWSHCVICNEVIENSDVHALCNELHEKLLKKALVVYKTPPNKFNILIENNSTPQVNTTTDSSEYYCATCNVTMHVNNTASHVNGTKHAMNSKSNLHYLMKQVEGADDLVCKVCNVHVVDSPTDVEKHVKTADHSKNLKEFLSTNYVRLHQNEFYCKPCDVKITKMNEFYHIEKLSHEVNLAVFKSSLDASNKVCESKVEVKTEEPKTVENLSSYYCHVCNVKIPNNPKNINSHNDGNKHRKNVSNVIAEIESAIERVASNIHYQMELTQNEKELKCKACNVIVPNREGNIDEHVIGLRHKNNEKKLMTDNHIEIKGDKYFCNACNMFIVSEQQFIHIKHPTHVKLLRNLAQKQEKPTDLPPKVEIWRDSPSVESNSTISDAGKSTEDNLAKNVPVNLYSVLKHHFADTDDPDIVKCRICSINILHTVLEVLNHANDKKHMEGYRDLMSKNLIFETDNSTFFCGICNCLVPGKGEFHHAFGLRHADNLTKATAGDHCDICDVDTVMKDHITTAEHIKKVKQNQTILNHCEICNALITKNDRDFSQHSVNCELMLKHRLVVKDKICFCIICDLYFARDLIEDHVQSNHHLLLFNMVS
ncbi:uncharacterized protein [Epargyreus clarus]|uniref:uncharacterized protein n=1 Tax=Epargyreus clarus TaxID=520877 RepID=UPI003C2D4105